MQPRRDQIAELSRALHRQKQQVYFHLLRLLSYNQASFEQLPVVLPFLSSADLESIAEQRLNNDLCGMPTCALPPLPVVKSWNLAHAESTFCGDACAARYTEVELAIAHNIELYGNISVQEYFKLGALGNAAVSQLLEQMAKICEEIEEAQQLDTATCAGDEPEEPAAPPPVKEVRFAGSRRAALEANEKELKSFKFTRLYMWLSKAVTARTKELFAKKVVNGFKFELVHKMLSSAGGQLLAELLDFVELQFNKNRIELEPVQVENELGLLVDSLDLGKPWGDDACYLATVFLQLLKYDVNGILAHDGRFKNWREELDSLAACFEF